MKNYFDLKGQCAIVTGCSTGLGVQMAEALANQGCNIVVVARRQNLIEEVASKIKETYGVDTLAVPCDITDTESVEKMVSAAYDKFGRIDILINNAGTGAVAPAVKTVGITCKGKLQEKSAQLRMTVELFGVVGDLV